uniref:Uncharacterized protein n=1 Tax=Musa acuminata subsp. malaccensis TaxID=214687 RepID=A0A804IDF2_MUSAM
MVFKELHTYNPIKITESYWVCFSKKKKKNKKQKVWEKKKRTI